MGMVEKYSLDESLSQLTFDGHLMIFSFLFYFCGWKLKWVWVFPSQIW